MAEGVYVVAESQPVKSVHYLARAMALAIPAVLIGCQLLFWVAALTSPVLYRYMTDFRGFYVVGSMVKNGHRAEIYQRDKTLATAATVLAPDADSTEFNHPAYEVLLFVPFAFLPVHLAYLLWVGLQLGLAFAVAVALSPHLPAFSEMRLPLFMLMMAFFPVSFAILQGQDSLILLLLIVCTLTCIKKEKLFCAGVLLGLGVFRFQIPVPIIMLFAAWKLRTLIGGFLVTATVCFIASLAVAGFHAQIDLIHLLHSYADPNGPRALAMTNLRALIAAIRGGVDSPGWTIAASLGALMIAWTVGLRKTLSEKFVLATSASCLVSYHLFRHDLSLVILPLFVLIDLALARRNYYLLVSAAVILATPVLLTMAGMQAWTNSFVPLGIFVLTCLYAYRQKILSAEGATVRTLQAQQ
jgi:hypothetical protein